eukprot:GGOE01061526.1.p1 GENE.GGOE01061526.1~~GGOE01061526.1.p1  ORF type:complete len:321 (-),score=117.59 GGOE01061526.1:259-1191(-)
MAPKVGATNTPEPSKRKWLPNEEGEGDIEDEDEEEEEEEEEEDEENSDAEIAYDFNTMAQGHLKPVMNLLDYFLPGPAQPDAVEAMAQSCLSSPFTTILCTPEEDGDLPSDIEVHGLISLIDLKPNITTALHPITQLIEVVDGSKYFAKLFEKGTVGFIICERVVAMKEIGAQLFINLFDEYNNAKSGPKYEYFLILGRVTLTPAAEGKPAQAPPKKKRKGGNPSLACLALEDVTEDRFLMAEQWVCWRHRVQAAPFLTLYHPENVMRLEDGTIAPNSKDEYSIPMVVEAAQVPQLLEEVKALDLYFASN